MRFGFYQDHFNEVLNSWTIFDLQEEMCARGHDVKVFSPYFLDNIGTYPAMVFYRCMHYNDRLIRQLRNQGVKIGYSIDDMIWQGPYACGPGIIKAYLNNSDFLLMPNHYITDLLPIKKPYVVRDPALAKKNYDVLSQASIRATNVLRIVVSKGHLTGEFTGYVNKIFSLLKERKINIEVFYFHNGPEVFSLPGARMHKIRYVSPLRAFFQKMKDINPDVILNPMLDDDFHRCKSYPKYLEAAALGSILVASKVRPYQQCIRDGENGFLCDTPEQVVEKLCWLSENPQGMLKMKRAARDDVYYKHLMPVIAKKFAHEFETFLTKLNGNSEAPKKQEEVVPVKVEPTNKISPPLIRGQTLEITIQSPIPSINRIEILGATYSQVLSDPISYRLLHKDRTLHAGAVPAPFMVDNNWWGMDFPSIHSEGMQLKLIIKNNGMRPISFYHAQSLGFFQQAKIGENLVEPIAMRLS